MCKDILGVRWRRRLPYIILAPTLCSTIGTETACEGVTGRYLESNLGVYERTTFEWTKQ